MDLTNQQIKDTYGNVLTIGATAGSPQTGTLQNGEGLNITSATLTGGTVTTSNPLLDMTQTWNDAGVTFTSLKLNVTDTASGASSLLLDLQVGGSSKFSVEKDGDIKLNPANTLGPYNIFFADTASFQYYGSAFGGQPLYVNFAGGVNINNTTGSFRINNDAYLARDAADTFAQRRGTNAQTFNIYNTYTDGSNYEGAALKWESNTLKIGTFSLGTGTNRNIQVYVGATQLLTIGGSAVELLKPLRANANYIEFTEMTAPSAPSTNLVRIYAEDNGSGKTKLMALFPSGAAQQIAIEP